MIIYGMASEKNIIKIEIKCESEYLHGQKNGKVKEYNPDGELIFEGEYLNGKIWSGKVNEYYDNGKISFEGEYLNGEKNGMGKEYYLKGKIKFEGEYLKGMKWNGIGYGIANNIVYKLKEGAGLVKEYDFACRLIFEGEHSNGQRWNGKYYELDPYGKLISSHEYVKGLKN